MSPAYHREIPLGTRVKLPKGGLSDIERTGTVVGISFKHIIYTYIVLFDEGSEMRDDDGVHRAAGIPGTYLQDMGGEPYACRPG